MTERGLAEETLPTRYRGPGLVDLQVNGFAGYDFNGDPEDWLPEKWHEVRQHLLRRGLVMGLDSPALFNALGLALRDVGQYGDALRTFEIAIRRWPHATAARLNRERLLRQMKKLREKRGKGADKNSLGE